MEKMISTTKLKSAVSMQTKVILVVGMLAAFVVGTAFAAAILEGGDTGGGLELVQKRRPVIRRELNVRIDTVNPASSLVQAPAVVDYSVAGRFDLNASDVPLSIKGMTFQVIDPDGGINGTWLNLTDLQLFENGVSISNVNVSSSTSTFILNTAIPAKTTKNYVLKANFNLSLGSESGRGLRLKLTDVVAIYNKERVSVLGLGNLFNTFSVVKSLPTIQVIPVSTSTTAVLGKSKAAPLIKFALSATNNAFGFYKISFNIGSGNVDVLYDSLSLYESTSPNDLGDVIARPQDFRLIESATSTPIMHVANVEAYLDIDDDNDTPAYEHRVLAAGQTRYYTLTAFNNVFDSPAAVSTTILTDAWFGANVSKNAAQIDADINNNFIWSDLNFDLYTTSTATNTMGWFNSFRVPTFSPLTPLSQTVTN